MQSAAMLIVKKNGGVWLHNDVVLRLQVDDSPEPLKELRRLVEKWNAQRRTAVHSSLPARGRRAGPSPTSESVRRAGAGLPP